MPLFRSLALSAVALATFLPATASATLITNGSFESHSPAIGGFAVVAVGSSQLTGWEVFDGSIDVLSIGTWDPSDGNYSIDLDGAVGDAGGVRQTFATTAGTTYEVRFDLAGNVATAPPTLKQMRVSADGQSAEFSFDITGQGVRNMGWTEIVWTLVADDASATLAFESIADEIGGFTPGWGAAIDNVRAVALPEPAALPLLALGALALGARRQG